MTQSSDKPFSSDKSRSFIARHIRRKSDQSSPRTPDLSSTITSDDALPQPYLDDFVAENFDDLVQDHDIEQVTNEIDQFIDTLSSIDDKSNPPDVPETVETFSKIIEARIAKYYSGDANARFGKMTEDDSFFFDAVNQISKLTNAFSDFPSDSATASSLNRTSMALQRAMSFLEEEFRDVLEGPRIRRVSSMDLNNLKSHSSFISRNDSTSSSSADHSSNNFHEIQTITEDEEEIVFPGYPNDFVTKMIKIANTMISAGYDNECCQIYSVSRRNAIEEALTSMDFEKTSIEDIQKMQWESLEIEIGKWIKSVKQCTTVFFPGERKLCDSVFSDREIADSLFGNLARAIVIQVLNFTDAVVLTKRSAEKLFKYLDMYETLRDLIPSIEGCSREVKSEILAATDRLGEAAVFIFCELENSIKGDAARTPVPGGAVHPLTRYVMNYLKYVCEYRDTLDHIFQKEKALVRTSSHDDDHMQMSPGRIGDKLTPFGVQLMTVIELLDENLEAKTKLYRDPSLQSVFLMNNGRYILQKVKGSTEILQLIGDTRYRVRSTVVRQYHKNYQRETWGKVLNCLSQEGLLQPHGKVQKQALKDRFKSFNNMIEEIHRNQSTWVVNEEQLQSELRVSISAVIIPAYRAFLGRFKHYLDGSRQVEKYIKYQPDDIETLIEDLFDGNALSMARRRT
ncbi:exocyst complex component EXO70B1-like [Impatiens glandulifera]|uniref:exocyst complex component EXO70B1-like n=1 Tax=Impatiens glandulifera TaxID=253017 RepID=UPI001FB10A8A|nr:exocyst complex component EXO70B1-like [Impatiens glandulifera]